MKTGGDLMESRPAPSERAALPQSRRVHFPRNILLLAVGFALLMFLCSMGLDWVLLRDHEGAVLTIIVSDGLAGLIAGTLVFRLLQYERERRKHVDERLRTIGEMNHHIRNALQVISFSVHSSKDQDELAGINEALDRIQWALREILPKMEPTFRPFSGSARGPWSRGELGKK